MAFRQSRRSQILEGVHHGRSGASTVTEPVEVTELVEVADEAGRQ